MMRKVRIKEEDKEKKKKRNISINKTLSWCLIITNRKWQSQYPHHKIIHHMWDGVNQGEK